MTRRLLLALALTAFVFPTCVQEVGLETRRSSSLAVGERASVELRYLRFDVANFEQVFTRADLLALPEDVRRRQWLLDLDLVGAPGAPRLLDNALDALVAADPETLSPAARNLQRVLEMTPETVDLTGTLLEELSELAPVFGIPSARVLADLLAQDVADPLVSRELLTEVLVDLLVASHPEARTRPGPVTASHPDGRYPVTPGALPITLEDALTDFASLAERFGPVRDGRSEHPGIVFGDVRASVFTEDFSMTVRANANALPYRGIRLLDATEGGVSSIPSQIDRLFDIADPNWLLIEGLVPGEPRIETLTLRILEHPEWVEGGSSPLPRAQGNSQGWTLAPWLVQRILLELGVRAWEERSVELTYGRPDREEPLFEASVQDGWLSLRSEGGVGRLPRPAYLWDVLLEIGQVRLRDGGLQPGEADIEVTLQDVPVGLDAERIVDQVRRNLEADPTALLELAGRLIDNSYGDVDFYYVRAERPPGTTPPGDYLVWVAPEDRSGEDADGTPPASTQEGRFYRDAALSEPVSSPLALEGPRVREAVRVRAGDVLHVSDREARVYRLEVGSKPSARRLRLDVERVR